MTREYEDEDEVGGGYECPRCGSDSQVGPLDGVMVCNGCGLMWQTSKDGSGRGWDWWSEKNGWTKAPEGLLTVLGNRS